MPTRVEDERSTAITRVIGRATRWLGSFPSIVISVAIVAAWLIGGFFVSKHFANNTYQLVINTATTIVTFLMVFIIQNTQNRDGRAMQTKLDAQSEALELILTRMGISDDDLLDELVGAEDAPEGAIESEQDVVRKREARHRARTKR